MKNEEKKPWEQQKGEKTRFYGYLEKYLQLGTNRSLTKLHEKHPKSTPKIDRLKQLSADYNWKERAEEYDKFIFSKRAEKYEGFINDVVDEQTQCLIKRIGFVNSNMKKLSEDVKSKPSSIAHALDKNSKSYKTELESLMLLLGKPTEIVSSENRNLNVNKDVDSTDELNKLFDDL